MTGHFLRDLGTEQVLLEKDRAVLTAPGPADLGVLVALVDIVGSDPAMASCPDDWLATRDLSLHTTGPVVEGPVVVDARVLRIGSTGVVVAATLYDGRGVTDPVAGARAIDGGALAVTASSLITFARIKRAAAAGMDHYRPGDWIGEIRRPVGDTTATSPVYDRLGARVIAPGVLELDCSAYVVNSIGTITGGAQAALVELAVASAVPGQVAADVQMHFLAQLRVGPMRTGSTVLRRGSGHHVLRVELRDAGDEDRLLTTATVTTLG